MASLYFLHHSYILCHLHALVFILKTLLGLSDKQCLKHLIMIHCSMLVNILKHGNKAVVNNFSTMSFTLSLQAHNRGMTYPRYAFITYGWYGNYWWVPQGDINCTVQEMEEVLNHSLALFAYPRIQNSLEVVDAGIVSTSMILYVYYTTMLCSSLVS